MEAIKNFLGDTGIAKLFADSGWWQYLVMYVIVGVLFYLAIVKKFEPLLLMPIAFGMLLANLPGADLIHLDFFFDDYYLSVTDGNVTGILAANMNDFLSNLNPAFYTLGEKSLVFNLEGFSSSDVEYFNYMFSSFMGDAAYISDGAVHIKMTYMIKEVINHGGLLDILYLGVKLGVYPSLIFLGVGAMTDFSPLIANPKSLLMGAGA